MTQDTFAIGSLIIAAHNMQLACDVDGSLWSDDCLKDHHEETLSANKLVHHSTDRL